MEGPEWNAPRAALNELPAAAHRIGAPDAVTQHFRTVPTTHQLPTIRKQHLDAVDVPCESVDVARTPTTWKHKRSYEGYY